MVQEISFFCYFGFFVLVEDYLGQFVVEWGIGVIFNVWSVGCFIGEEVYLLVMLISEWFWVYGKVLFYGIIGMDISLLILVKVCCGLFFWCCVEQIDLVLCECYFKDVDVYIMQVVDSLCEWVCFVYLNVLNLDQVLMDDMDLIFCQNMLIYFCCWWKWQIVNQLVGCLVFGGLLVLGFGEIIDWYDLCLEWVYFVDILVFWCW